VGTVPSADLRPEFREDSAESQVAEGGTNWNDNCVPTSFAMVMDALGYGDPAEPQDWTNYEYGASYHGVESGQAAIDFILAHAAMFPVPPAMAHESPADPVPRLVDLLNQRKPTVCYFSCDANAHIGPGGFGHASVPVASDGATTITIWNVWTGYEQVLTFDQVRAYWLGSFCVFDRTVTRTAAPANPIPAPAPPEDPPMRDLLITWPDGHLQRFRVSGTTLQTTYEEVVNGVNSHQWSLWAQLGPDAGGFDRYVGIALYPVPDIEIEVHAVRQDGSSWHFRVNPDGTWTGWQIGDPA
jgi:hypothetical protein